MAVVWGLQQSLRGKNQPNLKLLLENVTLKCVMDKKAMWEISNF